MLAVGLIGVLVLWSALSLGAQIRIGRWPSVLQYHDAFSLIPSWTFFAPRPGTSDVNLLYRDRLADGQLTPWREVALGDPGVLRWLWNPSKRRRKCVTDMCQSLHAFALSTQSLERVVLDLPYIALLGYVSALPRNGLHEATQFMVARTHGAGATEEPEIVFVSTFHSLT